MYSPPCYQHPHQMVRLLQLMNLHGRIITSQSLQFPLGFTLDLVHSVGLDKCIVTCIHHYDVMQSSFTALKTPCDPPIHPSLCPHPLATNDLHRFTVSIVLPFRECQVVRITRYVPFSGWLLSLSHTHLRFLHVFSWPDSSFLFSAE